MKLQRIVQVGYGELPCVVTFEHEGEGVLSATSIMYGHREIINRVTFSEIERLEDSVTYDEFSDYCNRVIDEIKLDAYENGNETH